MTQKRARLKIVLPLLMLLSYQVIQRVHVRNAKIGSSSSDDGTDTDSIASTWTDDESDFDAEFDEFIFRDGDERPRPGSVIAFRSKNKSHKFRLGRVLRCHYSSLEDTEHDDRVDVQYLGCPDEGRRKRKDDFKCKYSLVWKPKKSSKRKKTLYSDSQPMDYRMWWIDGISLHYDLLAMDLQFNDDGTLPQEDQDAIQHGLTTD